MISDSVIVDRLADLLEIHETLILICNTEDKAGQLMTDNWQRKKIKDLYLRPIETQDNSIIRSERYFFYRVSSKGLAY